MQQLKNDAAATRQRLRARLTRIANLAGELDVLIRASEPPPALMARLDSRFFQVEMELANDLADVEHAGTPVPPLAGFSAIDTEPLF